MRTDAEHTVDDDGDAEESKSDNPTVETETGYVSEESGNLSETETQEMTEAQNTEAENSSEHEDIDESEIESSLPETSTTGAEENKLLVETRLAVETDKSRAEAEQRLADGELDLTADIILYAKWIDNQPEDKDDSPYREAERIDLNAVDVKVSGIKDKVYDGKAYEPAVKVTITENGKSKALTEGIDYRIIYKDNINVGNNCRMLNRGSGIYGGEITIWYSIRPKPVKKLKVVTGNMAVGDTSAPPVYVYDGTKLLKKS